MASTLIYNLAGIVGFYHDTPLKLLRGKALDQLPILTNAWILIADGKVIGAGKMSDPLPEAIDQIDAGGTRWLFPGFVDSHTHLVFAKSREEEFEYRLRGLSYQEIAAKGGGILNSARVLQTTAEEELYHLAAKRLDQVIKAGTTAIEIKTGYGLSYEAERKMLMVIKKLKSEFPINIKATFLGAHAVPKEVKDKATYLQQVLQWMEQFHQAGLIDYVDIFCEQGYFSPEDALQLMDAASNLGLKSKIHGNQLTISGGVQAAVEANALTIDHLEMIGDAEISCLQSGTTLPVILPGCSFFLGIPYAPARKLIEADLPLVIASDFNPGTCPSGNMPLLWSIACTQLKLTPAEAFNAMTINAAAALELEHMAGSISTGLPANLWLSAPINSWQYIPYNYGFGADLVERVMINGVWYN